MNQIIYIEKNSEYQNPQIHWIQIFFKKILARQTYHSNNGSSMQDRVMFLKRALDIVHTTHTLSSIL
jgi:hypothetical protein